MGELVPYDGTEADAMDDSGFTVELDPDCEEAQREREERAERREEAMAETRADRKYLYELAQKARVGSTIKCPTCRKQHVKTTYHKVFCSNGKTAKRGKNNCKDRYWNSVDENRSFRAELYSR